MNAVEGERGAQGRCAQPRDHAVQPVRSRETPERLLERLDDGDVGEWVEEQVEHVRAGRRGRRLTAE